MTTHKVYVDTESLSKEELEQLLIDKDKENKRLVKNLAEYKNEITDLKEENKKLKDIIKHKRFSERYVEGLQEENKKLKEYKSQRTRKIERDNKKLKEENKLLKQCLDKLMFDTDVVNVKIQGELGDYCYVRSDKKFKLNIKD